MYSTTWGSLSTTRKAAEATAGIGTETEQQPRDLSDEARTIVDQAVEEAKRLKHHYIGAEHPLLALTRESG